MSSKRVKITAWILFGLCVFGSGIQFWYWLRKLSGWPSVFEVVNELGWISAPVILSALAILVISHQPGNRVGWLMILAGLGAANPLSNILTNLAPPSAMTPGLWLLIWVENYSWVVFIFPIFLIPLHFPTGQPPSRRWNWVNFLALGLGLFLAISGIFILDIGPMDAGWLVPNPIGFIPVEFFDGPFLILWGIGLLVMLSGSIVSLFVRYRRSGSVARQQIKWLLYAGSFFLVVYGLTYFLTPPDSSEGWGNIWLVIGILSIPAAVAIAILRYRLYDIDLIIRRTLQYSLLTGLLSLIYFGGVALLQALLSGVEAQSSPIVIVLTTLLIAALFNPLRRRLQDFIDRRFYRQKYDAEKALTRFAEAARSETDLAQLTAEMVQVARETLQPESLTVWLNTVPVSNRKEPR
jgi:hypothetical protein